MPVLRPSGSDFTSFVKAAAQYVAPGRNAKPSKSGGVPVALPGLGAVVRTSQVGALASPTTSAVIINGVTPLAVVAGAVIRVLLGIVTTLAGTATSTFANGTGTSARFSSPRGVAVIPSSGVIVVADQQNNRIRLVTYPGGVATSLAGQTTAGSADGTGALASFNNPRGVAVLPNGNIVVADTGNHRIRLVTPGGDVTTLAGSGSPAFADGTGAAASFNEPTGVAVTSSGVIVVADSANQRIRLVDPTSGVVTTLAGSTFGHINGTGASAKFWTPIGVTVVPSTDVIIVGDQSNNRIRLVTYPGGVVTTLAGNATNAFADGTGTAASFNSPNGVAFIPSTNTIVVADTSNHRIRLVTYPGGVVTTLAGSGSYDYADGTGALASFGGPVGVAVTLTGDIVVGDTGNQRIRAIA